MRKTSLAFSLLCSLVFSLSSQASQEPSFSRGCFYLSEAFKPAAPAAAEPESPPAQEAEPCAPPAQLPPTGPTLSWLTDPTRDSALWIHPLFDIEYYEYGGLAFLSRPDNPFMVAVRPTITYQVSNWILPGGELTAFEDTIEKPFPSSESVQESPKEEIFTERQSSAGILGLLLRSQSGWRLAVTYREKGTVSSEHTAELVGERSTILAALGPSGYREGVLSPEDDLPQALLVSGYNRVNERLALLASFGWLNWSSFEKAETLTGSGGPFDIQETYLPDAWHLGLGARYQVSKPWVITAGMGFDRFDSVSSDESGDDFDSSAGEQLRYATAIRYDPAAGFSIGAGYLYLEGTALSPDGFSSTLWGFDDEVHLFSIDFDWRF